MIKILHVPIFKEEIHFFIGEEKTLAKYNIPEVKSPFTIGFATTQLIKNRRIRLIWLKEYDVYNLIHEIVHVVDHIFNTRGIDDTETRAYLTEFIFKGLSEGIKESEI